jgi:subtilisin family serine protease
VNGEPINPGERRAPFAAMSNLNTKLKVKPLSKSLPILFIFLVFIFFPVSAFSDDKEKGRFVPGELLVKFRSQVSKRVATSLHNRIKAHRTKRFHIVQNLEHIKLPVHLTVEDALRFYRGLPEVEYAEPNYVRKAFLTPNDPSFSSLWGLHNTGQNGGGTPDADIDGPEAWDIQTGNSNFIVAVLDTGADWDHEDLAANIWINPGEIAGNGLDDDGNGKVDDVRGWDFVNDDNNPDDDRPDSHGTHVSGTIGARGNNDKGITGVCWAMSLMTLKAFPSSGEGSTLDIIDAGQYAINMGARILNASFGGDEYSQSEYEAIQSANESGVLIVAAAGNDGGNNDSTPVYPASYDVANIISVAASDRDDGLASFSNYGVVSVDVAAPGKSIYSTKLGDTYQLLQGTSMAAPHVSGLAALIWSNNPFLTHLLVKEIILDTVDPLDSMDGKVLTGGRINALNALSDSRSHPGKKGDINGDGILSQADVDNALQVLAGKTPASIRADYATSGVDVNGDGRIGMEEVIYIKEKLGGVRE